MAVGIIIHISVGSEKRTEFFTEERIRIGANETSDLQINTDEIPAAGVWFELENSDGIYRLVEFDPSLELKINDKPMRRFVAVSDGDVITIGESNLSFSFFSLTSKSALITTNRETPLIAQFIEEAALESAASAKRDDAKTFLREFTRELLREVTWTSKLIILVLSIGFITGVLYLG